MSRPCVITTFMCKEETCVTLIAESTKHDSKCKNGQCPTIREELKYARRCEPCQRAAVYRRERERQQRVAAQRRNRRAEQTNANQSQTDLESASQAELVSVEQQRQAGERLLGDAWENYDEGEGSQGGGYYQGGGYQGTPGGSSGYGGN